VGSFLYFAGEVVNCNQDGTFDIAMECEQGEEPDIETNVPRENIRKVSSNRLKGQFKKGAWAIVAINAFNTASAKGPFSAKHAAVKEST
jgi:hypothetical protein